MKSNIKTVCGLEKYEELSKSLLLRFDCITKRYWKRENYKGRIMLVL